MNDDKFLNCSFCGKSHSEVDKLIAGPSVYICDECVQLCVDIINEGYKAEGKPPNQGVVVDVRARSIPELPTELAPERLSEVFLIVGHHEFETRLFGVFTTEEKAKRYHGVLQGKGQVPPIGGELILKYHLDPDPDKS